MKTVLGAAAIVVVAIVVVIGVRSLRRKPESASSGPSWPALPHRVRVEVLNGGKVPGAARDGTILLRHAGLDVVNWGDAGSAVSGNERTQVLVRRGDTTGAGRVREVLGPVDVIEAPDASRLVELTVVLGKSFAAPRARP